LPSSIEEKMADSETESAVIELVIEARKREVAGFSVRRSLPSLHRRSVGPFVFVDHMGPLAFAPASSTKSTMDVLPHPHIGLSTVTYLFEGEIVHRDSIGSLQVIRPGDVNWMTAGSGIAHSERMTDQAKHEGGRSHGLQLWVGLPTDQEEKAPTFAHHGKETLPTLGLGNAELTVILGHAYGSTSPVAVSSPLFYVEAKITKGDLEVPSDHEERAAYVVSGSISCDGRTFDAGNLIVFRSGKKAVLRVDETSAEPAHVMLLGGARLDGPRYMWWNFVSSSKERIERAKRDWKEGRFAKVVGDETDYVPLPDT
jgi:redox-sensitive bicupin YhaK (pirin superfamily)